MTLAMATKNKELKIVYGEHEGKFKRKLPDMRIYNDTNVKKVKNDSARHLILNINGSRGSLGCEHVQKIIFEGK